MATERRRQAGWVGLYEGADGRLILHRDGSPYAYVIPGEPEGEFARDARELAAGELDRWDGEILVLAHLAEDQWPGRVGRLLALWDEGQLWG
ncbi:MAG: hypothetical protein ACREQ5_18745, partial [Candidatus Dormibacteria bacterium]